MYVIIANGTISMYCDGFKSIPYDPQISLSEISHENHRHMCICTLMCTSISIHVYLYRICISTFIF